MSRTDSFHLETIRIPRSWTVGHPERLSHRLYVEYNLYYLFTEMPEDFRFVQMDSDYSGRGVFACHMKHSRDWFVVWGECNSDGMILNGERAHIMHNLSDQELRTFCGKLAKDILAISF
jgi:hypothetical protein